MNYLPINWQDGMKINKDHFIGAEQAARHEMITHIAAGLNTHNYGLLPAGLGNNACDLYIKVDQSQHLVISLQRCNAISISGALIHIDHQGSQAAGLHIPIAQLQENMQEGQYKYVILRMDPFDRQPSGQPDPEEDPPRMPHTQTKYRIVVSDAPATAQAQDFNYELTIGRFQYKQGSVVQDDQYIPPCARVSSFYKLKEIFEGWLRTLGHLYEQSRKTIDQVYRVQERHQEAISFGGGQKTSVAQVVFKMSQALMTILDEIIPDFEQNFIQQAPIVGYSALKKFARRLRTTYNCFSEAEKNLFINYLKEILKLNSFLEDLDTAIRSQYDHGDMAESLNEIQQMINMLSKLYDQHDGLPTKDYNWTKGTIVVEDRPEGPGDILFN